MPDDEEITGSTGFRNGLPPVYPRTCILTGEPGENPDDCTTHDHEQDRNLTEKLLDHALHEVEIIVHHEPDRVSLICYECDETIIEVSVA